MTKLHLKLDGIYVQRNGMGPVYINRRTESRGYAFYSDTTGLMYLPNGKRYKDKESIYDLVDEYQKEPVQETRTLRDEFAMAALACVDKHLCGRWAAGEAYEIADAMLEARK